MSGLNFFGKSGLKRFSGLAARTKRVLLLAAVLLFVSAGAAFAASSTGIKVPAMNGPVNDNAGLISSSDEAKLSEYLNRINDKTGIQLAVLTIDSLEGHPVEMYSMAVCEEWQLGQKGEDNGVLLLVAFQDHEFRIEVGYGLEGTLTDMASGIILRNVITPYFKEGEYSTGILAGMQAIGILVAPSEAGLMEGVPQTTITRSGSSSDADESIAGLIFMLVFILIMATVSSRKNRYGRYRRRGYRRSGLGQAAETLFWLNALNNSSSSHRSGGSGFKGGGFSGGSFGGHSSGFSGGGGHFGGGGASGKW